MSYDPHERIRVLMALNRALLQLEQLGISDTRPTYDHAATCARLYLRAYDIYMSHDEPIRNLRVETQTITEYRHGQ
jgi:hypothetical protein